MDNTTALKKAGDELRAASETIERIDSQETVELDLQVGQGCPQGDIMLVRLDELPARAERIEVPKGGQIAPGTSRGSRHCIAAKDRDTVKYYRVSDGDRLSDLCLLAPAPFTLEHPEHGHHRYLDKRRIYRVIHQQNEKNERIRD